MIHEVYEKEGSECPEEYFREVFFDGMCPKVFVDEMVWGGGDDEEINADEYGKEVFFPVGSSCLGFVVVSEDD
jgi:hypothetical protein